MKHVMRCDQDGMDARRGAPARVIPFPSAATPQTPVLAATHHVFHCVRGSWRGPALFRGERHCYNSEFSKYNEAISELPKWPLI